MRLVQREARINLEVERSCKALAAERDERVSGVAAVKVRIIFVCFYVDTPLVKLRNRVTDPGTCSDRNVSISICLYCEFSNIGPGVVSCCCVPCEP